MVQEMVAKIMKKALVNLAEKEGSTPEVTDLFIHTKPSEENPQMLPKYFCAVNGKPVRENGGLKDLRFVQDVLGEKMDLLGKEYLTQQFLQKFFKNTVKEHSINPREIYIRISSIDDKAKKLNIGLYHNGKLIKPIELSEIFTE